MGYNRKDYARIYILKSNRIKLREIKEGMDKILNPKRGFKQDDVFNYLYNLYKDYPKLRRENEELKKKLAQYEDNG